MATAPTLYWYQLDVGTYAPLYYKQLDDTVRDLCTENGVTPPTAHWYNAFTGTLVSSWSSQIDVAVRALCVLFSISPPSEQVYNLTYGQLEPQYSADLDSIVRQLCGGVGVVPHITSNGGGDTATVDITTSDTAVTTVTATGSAPITFTKSGTDSALFTLNSSTGVLSLVTTEPAAAYSVTVTATNSSGHDDQAITVNVSATAFNPGDIANLIRGWDFNDVTGSNITSVPAAWGTSVTLTLGGTVGSPDVLDAFSPNLKNMLDTTSSNAEVGTFTSTGAMSAFTFFCVLAPKTAVAVPLIGGPSTAYIQLNASSGRLSATQVKTNTSSAQAINFPTTSSYLWSGGCYLVVITFDGTTGTFTYRINGISNTQVRGASSCTYDRLFRQAAVATYGSGMWSLAGIYSRVLTAGEISQLETGLSAYKATAIYLSQTGDDSIGFGFSTATPKKTLAAANAYGGIAQRTGISFKPGDTWNEQITSTQAGTDTSNRFTYNTWTSSQLAYLWQVPVTTGWVDAGGGLWTKSGITVLPQAIWYMSSVSTAFNSVNRLSNAATSSDFTYTWDDPTDTVTARFTTGVDPNVSAVRINAGVAAKGFSTSAGLIECDDISFRYWSGEGIYTVGSDILFNRCDSSWNLGDGLGDHAGGPTVFNSGWLNGNGPGLDIDGASSHTQGNMTVTDTHIEGNSSGGVRSEQYTDNTVTSCVITGNGHDVIILQQGAGAGPATNTYTGNTITTTAASLTGYPGQIQSGVTSDVSMTMTGNTFTNSGGSQSNHAVDVLGGTFTDGGGDILNGYDTLTN